MERHYAMQLVYTADSSFSFYIIDFQSPYQPIYCHSRMVYIILILVDVSIPRDICKQILD